jgi:hypothetical protein
LSKSPVFSARVTLVLAEKSIRERFLNSFAVARRKLFGFYRQPTYEPLATNVPFHEFVAKRTPSTS